MAEVAPGLGLLELEVIRLAPSMHQWIHGSCCKSQSVDLDKDLWDAAMEDARKGWAEGPYSLQEATVLAGDRSVCSRHFAVRQKNKTRAIDDFSASHINRCTGVREKVQVESVDAAAVMIRQWMTALRGTGRRLVGKAFDLKAAYRQVGIHSDHLHAAWICVFCPDTGKPALFRFVWRILERFQLSQMCRGDKVHWRPTAVFQLAQFD